MDLVEEPKEGEGERLAGDKAITGRPLENPGPSA
jgi:hypothetical protein